MFENKKILLQIMGVILLIFFVWLLLFFFFFGETMFTLVTGKGGSKLYFLKIFY